MERMKKEYKSIDEYIRPFPKHTREKLEEMRRLILEQAPDAQEKISYNMPAFFLDRNLVYFAGYSKHIGFYPGSSAIHAFKSKVSKYKNAKGSVQFPLEEQLPRGLIKQIVRFRVAENMKKEKK